MAMGTDCAAHKHRELVPLEIHHVHPLGMGGADEPSNKVSVCSNAHSSIHDYLHKLVKHSGCLPWTVRRLYGVKVRRLAERGYKEWKAKNEGSSNG